MPNDINGCIRAALTELGGDKRLLPGARVAAQAIRLGAQDDFDFKEALRASGKTFLDAVKLLVASDDLQFIPRQGSDFLLGFSGAPLTDPTITSQAIREDFFRAFTRIRDAEARYLVDEDRIVYGDGLPLGGIPIPTPTSEDAWNLRRKFAESLEQSASKGQLLELLSDASRSFSRYSAFLHAQGLEGAWARFRYEELRSAISRWAADASIPVRSDWFPAVATQRQRAIVPRKPARATFLSSLTAYELSRILIPADIVEALLERQARQ